MVKTLKFIFNWRLLRICLEKERQQLLWKNLVDPEACYCSSFSLNGHFLLFYSNTVSCCCFTGLKHIDVLRLISDAYQTICHWNVAMKFVVIGKSIKYKNVRKIMYFNTFFTFIWFFFKLDKILEQNFFCRNRDLLKSGHCYA